MNLVLSEIYRPPQWRAVLWIGWTRRRGADLWAARFPIVPAVQAGAGRRYLSHFFKIRLALVPPKPKELHMAYSQAICFEPSAM